MKLKNSLKKKILTSLLVGASLTGFVSSSVFAYSNSSDGEYASKEASDKIINEIKQEYRSRASRLEYKQVDSPMCWLVGLRNNLYLISGFGRSMVGRWKIEDKVYYFDPHTLKAQRGWYNVTDSSTGHNGRYYFKPKDYSAFKGGVYEVGYEKFCFNDDGTVSKGLTHSGGKTYFGDNRAGVLVNGWYSTGGKRYLFDKYDNCAAHTGWYADGTAGYMHFNSDGAMSTGVTKVEDCKDKSKNGIYLFRPHGNGANTYLTTGYYSDTMTDKRYYFKPSDGKATTNEWLQVGSGSMYFGNDGAMAKGVTKIGDDTFVFTRGRGHDWNYYKDFGWYTDPETDARYYFGGYRGEALKDGVYCIEGCNCRFNDEGIFQGYVSNY